MVKDVKDDQKKSLESQNGLGWDGALSCSKPLEERGEWGGWEGLRSSIGLARTPQSGEFCVVSLRLSIKGVLIVKNPHCSCLQICL